MLLHPRAFALIFTAIMLALVALACEDDTPPTAPASESIAAALTAVPTVAPAPPTAVPTATPAPLTVVPTNPSAPAVAWLPTALPSSAPAPPTTRSSWPTPPTHTSMPTSAPAPTSTSTTANEARRVYEDAIDAMNALSSYRLRTDMIFAVGDVGKISTDSYIQRSDLGKSKTVIGGGGQTPVETGSIVVGDYTYTKPSVNLFRADDPNRGKWIRKYTGDEPLYEFESGPLSGIGAGAVVGTERFDGVETLRLKGIVYSNSFGLDMYAPMEARIWVGVEDGLIRRVTAGTSPDADERIGVTMIFSDFDVPVAVEAPKDYITLNTESFDIPHYAPAEVTYLDSDSRWRLAHLRDYGFSVSTPPDWFIHESRRWSRYNPPAPQPEAAPAAYRLSAAILQYVFPGQITAYERDETGVSVFNATIIGTLGDAALSEYVDDRIEHAKALLVIDGAIDRRAETLPAGDAERVEFAFRFRFPEVFSNRAFGMQNAAANYAQVQYFILSEGDAYILTFATTADRIADMRPTFDEIARTVRIDGRSP